MNMRKVIKGAKPGIIDCSCPSYVDDGALVTNSLRNLQIMVNIAYIHACKYHYEFHADKSCVVIFGGKKQQQQRTIQQSVSVYIGRKAIPQKQPTVHLGVRQDSNRSLSTRVRESCAKGTISVFSMANIGVRPCGLPLICIKKLSYQLYYTAAKCGIT